GVLCSILRTSGPRGASRWTSSNCHAKVARTFPRENHDMRKLTATILAGAASLAAFTTLHAQGGPQQLPGQADVGRVEAGTYKVDSAHSMVGWKLDHFGFNDYFGIFGDVAGTITVDPANPTASSVDVTIPIASVVVPSAGLRDHLLRPGADGKAADFFG